MQNDIPFREVSYSDPVIKEMAASLSAKGRLWQKSNSFTDFLVNYRFDDDDKSRNLILTL